MPIYRRFAEGRQVFRRLAASDGRQPSRARAYMAVLRPKRVIHTLLQPNLQSFNGCAIVCQICCYDGRRQEEMVDKKERTVSYRRADWLIGAPKSINLASC